MLAGPPSFLLSPEENLVFAIVIALPAFGAACILWLMAPSSVFKTCSDWSGLSPISST